MPTHMRRRTRAETPLMRKFLILAVAGAALLVSACNTVSGAGRDVSSVGSSVTDAANDAK